MDGRTSRSTTWSLGSMSSSSGSGPAPATTPCQTPHLCRNAFTRPASIRPRSLHLYFPMTYVVLAVVPATTATTAKPKDHATPDPSTTIPALAITTVPKCGHRPPHRNRGRTASTCPSRPLYTTADMPVSAAYSTHLASLSCPRRPPSPTPSLLLYQKTMTKIFPFHLSR
jgi:hypothetical protein